jgi:hypothetical protein
MHPELIALALKDSKPERPEKYTNEYHCILVQWNVTCENMAYHLAKNTPNFKRNYFLTKCGYLPA